MKRIDWADVVRLVSPHITSTYELALVCEWIVENMRHEFTPYTDEEIAGCGSILNGLFKREAKSNKPQMQSLRDEIATALRATLMAPKYVIEDKNGHWIKIVFLFFS